MVVVIVVIVIIAIIIVMVIIIAIVFIIVMTKRTLMTLTPTTPTWCLPDFSLRLFEPLSPLSHVFIMVVVMVAKTVMMFMQLS